MAYLCRVARAVVYFLFLLSGATGLIFEVAWTRRLVLLLGSTSVVVSLIFAAWMLGLGLGARIFGRAADRSRRPLLLYAALEAGVGGLALAFPLLLSAAGGLGGPSRVATGVLAFFALLLPTTLMGGTLPVLARFVARGLGTVGGRVGLLYALNTLGAVGGTVLGGFVLIRSLGVYGSTVAAAIVNLAVAAAAALLARRVPAAAPPAGAGAETRGPEDARGPEEAEEAARPTPAGRAPSPSRAPLAALLLAAFASGFVTLASEVLWTRMLVFFLEGFTFAFSAMLAVFLLGLSLGAAVSGFVADRLRDPRRYAGLLLLLSALVSAGVLLALTRTLDVTRWAKTTADGLFSHWQTVHAASLFLAAFVVLFPPSLVMGGVFPVVVRMAAREESRLGTAVGSAYSLNTFGSVAGSLAAGLVLTPLFGAATSAAVVLGASAVAGLVLLGRRALPALPLAAAAAALVLLAAPGRPMILRSHVFRGERGLERVLADWREGVDGAVSVVEDRRNGVRAVYTDAFEAAATGPQYKYMRLLAHLPLLLHESDAPLETLVICFGTGTTAGSASVHPLAGLDVVEISRDVLAHAPRFADVNKGVLEGRRPFPVAVHVEDGRNFLLRARRAWDLITLEPLMPYTPGAVHLYTEDFYRLCRDRLAPGGILCQWFPIHSMSSDSWRMLLATFVAVFPESSLWFVEGTTMLLGSTRPIPLDYVRLAARMRRPGVAEDLRAISFADPRQVLNAYVLGGEALRRTLSGASVMTDEKPEMEFRAIPVGFASTFLADNLAILHGLRRPVTEVAALDGVPPGDREALRLSLDTFFEGGQAFLEAEHFMALAGYHDATKRRDDQRDALRQALAAYDRAVERNPEDASATYLRRNAHYGFTISLGMKDLADGRLTEAEECFRRAAAMDNPFKPDLAFTWLARALNRRGRPAAALAAADEALERFPGSPTAHAERALALLALERPAEAVEAMHLAFASTDVAPESDETLVAGVKELRRMEEKGLVPATVPAGRRAALLIEALRSAPESERPTLMERLRAVHYEAPEAVRSALAPDMDRARDPGTTGDAGPFALRVLVAAGDLPGTLDLLRTGAPRVREEAADALGHVRRREVVPALIEAMEDPDRAVREAAWASLFGLTGRRPEGYEPDGPVEERARAVATLREWWANAGPAFDFR